MIDPNAYKGGATCGWKGDGDVACDNPARWMPVLVFVAEGHRETKDTRVPAALVSLGACDVCRPTVERIVAQEMAPGFGEQLRRGFAAARLAEPRFDRVHWVEIARRA